MAQSQSCNITSISETCWEDFWGWCVQTVLGSSEGTRRAEVKVVLYVREELDCMELSRNYPKQRKMTYEVTVRMKYSCFCLGNRQFNQSLASDYCFGLMWQAAQHQLLLTPLLPVRWERESEKKKIEVCRTHGLR